MIIGAAMILFHVAHGFMPCRPTLSTFAVAAAMILFYVGHDFMPCRPTLSTSAAGEESTVVEIASNVFMPRANLGTCCGSEAIVSTAAWLKHGQRGIDTAFDYGGIPRGGPTKWVPGGLQTDIRKVLSKSSVPRRDLFITSKVPAGLGLTLAVKGKCAAASEADAIATVLRQVRADLTELGTAYLDLVLLHAPCRNDPTGQQDVWHWRGLELALRQNLTRSIGVSNYNAAELRLLAPKAVRLLWAVKRDDADGPASAAAAACATYTYTLPTSRMHPTPSVRQVAKIAVNQCEMAMTKYDADGLAASQELGVTYEAWGALRGCPIDRYGYHISHQSLSFQTRAAYFCQLHVFTSSTLGVPSIASAQPGCPGHRNS